MNLVLKEVSTSSSRQCKTLFQQTRRKDLEKEDMKTEKTIFMDNTKNFPHLSIAP